MWCNESIAYSIRIRNKMTRWKLTKYHRQQINPHVVIENNNKKPSSCVVKNQKHPIPGITGTVGSYTFGRKCYGRFEREGKSGVLARKKGTKTKRTVGVDR